MRISKRWRIWLGVCAIITAPLLLGDTIRIVTTPPAQFGPLPTFDPVVAEVRNRAALDGNIDMELIETRAEVPGGSVGWSPDADVLPSEPIPTTSRARSIYYSRQRFDDLYTRERFDDRKEGRLTVPHRFTVRTRIASTEASSGVYTAVMCDPGMTGDLFKSDSSGATLERADHDTSGWDFIPVKNTHTDVYAGVALPSEARVIARFPSPLVKGVSEKGGVRWRLHSGGWGGYVKFPVPWYLRPRRAGYYVFHLEGVDSQGNVLRQWTRTGRIHHTTDSFEFPVYTLRNGAESFRVVVTPVRWVKFPRVRVGIPSRTSGIGDIRLKSLPMPPGVRRGIERARSARRGRSVSSPVPVIHARREDWTSWQLFRPTPHRVVISEPYLKPDEDTKHKYWDDYRMDVYLPDDFPRKETDTYTLVVTTPGGKHTREMLPVESGGDRKRLSFLVEGFPPDIIREVSLYFDSNPKESAPVLP